MKYNVISDGKAITKESIEKRLAGDLHIEFDVILEDGGVACVRFDSTDDRMSTTDYYQSRITDEKTWVDVWENLSEGKMYYNDWTTEQSGIDDLITDALNWLGIEGERILDTTLFIHLK